MAVGAAAALILGFVSCSQANDAAEQADQANAIASQALTLQQAGAKADSASDAAQLTIRVGGNAAKPDSYQSRYVTVSNGSPHSISDVALQVDLCSEPQPNGRCRHLSVPGADSVFVRVGSVPGCVAQTYLFDDLDAEIYDVRVNWKDSAGSPWVRYDSSATTMRDDWGPHGMELTLNAHAAVGQERVDEAGASPTTDGKCA